MNLLIIGAGGHGKCCYEIAERMNCFDLIDFVDDNVTSVFTKSVVGKQTDLKDLRRQYDCAFVAIGNNLIRKEISQEIKKFGFKLVNLIDPKAFVSSYANLGKGIVIFPNAAIETESHIEDGCVISANSVVHHNAKIKEYSLIYSNCVIRPTVVVDTFVTLKSGTILENS